MAKQKQKAKTPEEALREALVPSKTVPYEIPANWCWVKVNCVCEFERGITFPASAKEIEFSATNIPCLRTANVQDELALNDLIYVDKKYMKNNSAKLVRMNDIIMSSANSRELVGKVSYVHHLEFPMTFGGFVMAIRAKSISSQYLFYFLRLEFLLGHFIGESAQTTNIANINASKLGGYNFPLPPLAEQQRIVDRIESLFAKLDEAREKAEAALASFELRRAAILHKAFTGALTVKWREEHGAGMESWRTVTIKEICHSLKYGTAKKSEISGKVVVIRMGNLQNGEIIWDNLAYSNDSEDIEKYLLKPGDVLFNRTNSAALVGKTSIYRGEYPAIYAGYIIKLDYDRNRIIGDFLNYALNTVEAKAYCDSVKTDGVNQSNINAQKIGAYQFSLPSLPEQKEIIRLLDDFFAKEQKAKALAESVLKTVDTMKQSILARAFRGKLGTGDSGDESARDMLLRMYGENEELGMRN